MKDTNGLPVRFDCDCAECESDQADEIKRLRAQVAELLELARNLDYDFYAVVGTGPYVQHEVLARYPSVTDCNYCDGGFVAVNGWVQPCPKCGSPKRSPTDGYPSVTDEP